MGILSWLVLGLIAGFLASKIVNKTGDGLVLDIVLGIVGAVVGGVRDAFCITPDPADLFRSARINRPLTPIR